MLNKVRKYKLEVIHFILALSIIAFVYGSIPFVSIPTLGQALWRSGFARSLVNSGNLFSIAAINFGMPETAPLALGLSEAFLQSTIIRILNIHPADAYSIMSILILALSLFGTIKLCQLLGQNFRESTYLSLIYLTLPLIWRHADYSVISLGFALLPLYVFMSIRIIYFPMINKAGDHLSSTIFQIFSYFALCLFSVFTDGYSFVMNFFSAMILWIIAFVRNDVPRKKLFFYSLFVIIVSVFLSYLAYTGYLRNPTFTPEQLDFFRGFGIDVTMLFIPSTKVHWLWDTLGLSVLRSSHDYFGDASVWSTTFVLPLLIFGILGFIFCRKERYALPLLLIAISGLYFSLGPSLKINSLRPYELVAVNNDTLQSEDTLTKTPLVIGSSMPEEFAVFPTGSAFFYQYIPGFKNMRATYRWIALLFLGLFCLAVLLYQYLGKQNKKYFAVIFVVFLVINNLPDMSKRVTKTIHYRDEMLQIDNDLVKSLHEIIGEEKVVFFAPPGNDFLINYISSMGGYYTYNIGGDKNLQMARENWPREVLQFPLYTQDTCFDYKIMKMLNADTADYVVLPYFDTVLANNKWPPSSEVYSKKKARFTDTLSNFKNDQDYLVIDNPYYAVISLVNPGSGDQFSFEPILEINQPINISDIDCKGQSIFVDGWHNNEGNHIWSSANAKLQFSVADECQQYPWCDLALTFRVFTAKEEKSKTIFINQDGKTIATLLIDHDQMISETIPLVNLDKLNGKVNLQIIVPDAISPFEAGESVDGRTLGIDLSEFEIIKPATLELKHYNINSLDQEIIKVLSKGWYEKEGDHIWSSGEAEISFVAPEQCQTGANCNLTLWFDVFNANSSNSNIINIEVNGNLETMLKIDSDGKYEESIMLQNLDASYGRVNIKISIPEAVSPNELGISADGRVLGIDLFEFELNENSK